MEFIIALVAVAIEIAAWLTLTPQAFLIGNGIASLIFMIFTGVVMLLVHRPISMPGLRMRTTSVNGLPVTTVSMKNESGDVSVTVLR